jgi:heme/copper-type cytochrome/quinol oxidase subunit 2
MPRQTVAITAERFHFTPDSIHVRVGTLIHLELRATDGAHGFQLSEYGIDESLDKGETKVIDFVAQQKGTCVFRCSHFCGLGHFGMNGTLIVE